MIKKLDDGATLITLGEGTLYSGVVKAKDDKTPFGIGFSNIKGENVPNTENVVIIQITSKAAVASYLMALVRLLETWESENDSEMSGMLADLAEVLEPLMPVEKQK
jgi:hypothetical protein